MQGDGQIFDAYAGRLRRFVAGRVRHSDDVDDIVQETFLRFLKTQRDGEIQHPLGYLYRIALNLVIDRTRRRSPLAGAVELDEVAERHLATPPPQEEAQHLSDLQRAYTAALAELPPRCAEVFDLRRHRAMTTPDVAAHLSITPRMVQKHMVAAMAHLHARLHAYLSDDAPVSVPARCQIASSSATHA